VDARIVHNDVQPAEAVHNRRDHSVDGTRVRDIGGLDQYLVGGQTPGDLFQRIFVAVDQGHLRALRNEAACCRFSDAGSGSRDDDDLAFEPLDHWANSCSASATTICGVTFRRRAAFLTVWTFWPIATFRQHAAWQTQRRLGGHPSFWRNRLLSSAK